jgi:hypothetical protein
LAACFDAKKFSAKRKLDSAGLSRHTLALQMPPERVEPMKRELQLADSLAQFPSAKKMRKLTNKPLLLRPFTSAARRLS